MFLFYRFFTIADVSFALSLSEAPKGVLVWKGLTIPAELKSLSLSESGIILDVQIEHRGSFQQGHTIYK